MTTIQTVCLFVTGYLVSRLVLRAGAHEVFVSWLVHRSRGSLSRVVLGVMLASFVLSTIVPNALTVLAVIPVVARLRAWAVRAADTGSAGAPDERTVGTLLAMGLIYGANIGGVGSLLGSPANLYLLVNLRIFDVPGRESLHFVSWLSFGLPMAAALVLGSWAILRVSERRAMGVVLPVEDAPTVERGPLLAPALRWTAGWAGVVLLVIIVALVLGPRPGARAAPAFVLEAFGGTLPVGWLDLVAVMGTVLFSAALFLWPVRVEDERLPLLGLRDLTRELPWKGVALGAGVLVLLVIVARSGVVGVLRAWIPSILPEGLGPFGLGLILVLCTIFATEVLNNTTVSTVLFPVAFSAAPGVGGDPLLLMLGVSLASTCAFMTPVATPVNALAFGGIGGVSLWTFVKNGFFVNLLGGLWIAVWLAWVIPWLLALFR